MNDLSTSPAQLDLFEHVLAAYAGAGEEAALSNAQLYRGIGEKAGIEARAWEERAPIGRAGQAHSPLKRKVRWFQQSLRQLGLLERDESRGRGFWKLTRSGQERLGSIGEGRAEKEGKDGLTPAPGGRVLVAFSTRLGVALWASANSVFPVIDEPIHALITSTPYPLLRPRSYGNPSAAEFVDWLCAMLEPIVKNLVPGGTIALNVSNDCFEKGTPARSTYRERLVVALEDRLGLAKLDELIWFNNAKAPGPVRWASITRQALNVAWEPIYLFTNDAKRSLVDNRRVLQPHTEQHLKLLSAGGEARQAVYGDGAYRLRDGSFGRPTAGRIPKNVLQYGHRCPDKDRTAVLAREQGLPVHAATMPLKLARFLVELLTAPGDLVVDAFGGWFATAKAAEDCGRRWLVTELMREYVLGGANRFRQAEGFEMFGAVSGQHG